jgi:hypothetical protein
VDHNQGRSEPAKPAIHLVYIIYSVAHVIVAVAHGHGASYSYTLVVHPCF